MAETESAVMRVNEALRSAVWGVPMLLLLLGAGLFLMLRLRFFPLAKFGHAMRETLGRMLARPRVRERGSLSPFQAVTTALAATVGTGNIAGVAGAIALGGPGALFWMWASALLGMATKYAEVLLAVRFRVRNAAGDWVGGPMYYIVNGLGPRFRPLASLFAFFGMLAAFGIGNMTQANTIGAAVYSALQAAAPVPEPAVRLCCGAAVALLAAVVLLGGLKRIGRVTEALVPVMSGLYILLCLAVIIANAARLPGVFREILVCAFRPEAAGGGLAGVGMLACMRRGVSRGVFSNEAGLGSAPMAHAAAHTDSPVKQGLYGIFEVFMDTMVICTLTGLAILCSGVAPGYYGHDAGAELTAHAFTAALGEGAGMALALGICLFAASTILSWSLYGARCAEYLFGARAIRPYQAVYCLLIVAGAAMRLTVVWGVADTLNGLMALPNLVAVLGLSGEAARLTQAYRARLRGRGKK